MKRKASWESGQFKMSENKADMQVQEILDERRGAHRVVEYLVRWKGFSKNHDSWVPAKNLEHANEAISNFKSKSLASKPVRSRNRSKSSSQSRSRGRDRSKSKSPARSKKTASPSRTARARGVVSSSLLDTAAVPTKQETKTVAVTNLPDRKEMVTETVTKSVDFPSESRQSTFFRKTTEVRTLSKVGRDSLKATDTTDGSCHKSCCDNLRTQVQNIQNCCRKGFVKFNYPTLVVFTMVAVIILTFVLEQYVDFSPAGQYLSSLFPKGA